MFTVQIVVFVICGAQYATRWRIEWGLPERFEVVDAVNAAVIPVVAFCQCCSPQTVATWQRHRSLQINIRAGLAYANKETPRMLMAM